MSPENTGFLIETHFYLSIKAGKLLYNLINSILGLGTQANRFSSLSHQVMYAPLCPGKCESKQEASSFRKPVFRWVAIPLRIENDPNLTLKLLINKVSLCQPWLSWNYEDHVGLELTKIRLSLPPKCQDSMHVLPLLRETKLFFVQLPRQITTFYKNTPSPFQKNSK